jgi:MFS transporter, YNFM family, putative membrane transport protein
VTDAAEAPDGAASAALQSTVYLATFFIRFGFGITLSLYAFYLGSSFGTSGIAAAAAPAVEASTVIFWGILADRYGRLPVLKAGLMVGASMLLLMSTTRDVLVQGFLNAIFGISSAAILAASLAVTGDLHDRSNAGRAMGWFDAVNLFGWIAGFASGYFLVYLVNGVAYPGHLAGAFLIGAGAVLLALAIVLVRTRGYGEVLHTSILRLDKIRAAVLDPDILLVVLPWGGVYMLIGAILFYLGPAATGLHIPLWELGAGIIVGGSLLLASQPFYGRLADRWGRSRVMMVGILGFLGVLVAAALLLGFPGAPTPVTYGGYGLLGVSALAALALGPSSLAALSDLSRTISRATTMSLYGVVIASGMAIGLVLYTLLAHALGNQGIAVFFGFVGAYLGGLTLVRLSRRAHGDHRIS